ncbi:MAG: hypothetical protein U0075_10180 [Thermomicrobiales bacterium]
MVLGFRVRDDDERSNASYWVLILNSHFVILDKWAHGLGSSDPGREKT